MNMSDAMQPGDKRWLHVELQQAEHLRVAVLLDEINSVMLLHEIMHLARKWVCAQPQVIGLDIVLLAQLVAAFENRPVR